MLIQNSTWGFLAAAQLFTILEIFLTLGVVQGCGPCLAERTDYESVAITNLEATGTRKHSNPLQGFVHYNMTSCSALSVI